LCTLASRCTPGMVQRFLVHSRNGPAMDPCAQIGGHSGAGAWESLCTDYPGAREQWCTDYIILVRGQSWAGGAGAQEYPLHRFGCMGHGLVQFGSLAPGGMCASGSLGKGLLKGAPRLPSRNLPVHRSWATAKPCAQRIPCTGPLLLHRSTARGHGACGRASFTLCTYIRGHGEPKALGGG